MNTTNSNFRKENSAMLEKTRVTSLLDELKRIGENNNISKLVEDIEILNKEVKNYKAKVLFVGSFNAGKSALINSFINRDLLEENIVPETDIATELMHGDIEHVMLTNHASELISCPIENIKEYSAKEYSKYCYVINNTSLKKINDYIIVDMPGFDSGIEHHNKALMQYIDKGTIYVLVVDCEKGGISDSVALFISEIKNYSNNIGIILSKCDKKTPSDIEMIKSSVESQIAGLIGYTPSIMTTSKYDDKISERLYEFINSFEAQMLFDNKFNNDINVIKNKLFQTLTVVKESLEFNSEEIDKKMHDREKSKKILLDKMDIEKKKLRNKLQNKVKFNILNDVSNALNARASDLAISAQSGGQAFSHAVNRVIRSVLIESTERNIEISFQELVADLQFSELGEVNSKENENQINAVFGKLQEISSKAESYNGLYKSTLTVLAVTTTVVAPWLELVLIFLPEIIKLLGGISKNNQVEMIRNKIIYEIIPQIISKLEPEIQKSLIEIEKQMIEEIEKQFNELVSIEIGALEELKTQKNQGQINIDDSRKEVENDIERICTILI